MLLLTQRYMDLQREKFSKFDEIIKFADIGDFFLINQSAPIPVV